MSVGTKEMRRNRTDLARDSGAPSGKEHQMRNHLFHTIPDQLRQANQWVLWRYHQRQGQPKPTKPPCDPAGKFVDETQAKNWLTFRAAVKAYEQNPKLDGIGIALTPELGLVGIDLDDCLSDAGLEPWAAEIVHRAASYTEISPSGRGLRIFVRGKLPGDTLGRRKGKLEMYAGKRYLTVTGRAWKGATP